MYTHTHMHVYRVLMETRRVLDQLKLELGTVCKLSGKCWEPNPGPVQEWQVLLTTELYHLSASDVF